MVQEDFNLKDNAEWWVMRETFEDIDDLADYIKKTPPNKFFRNRGTLGSEKEKESDFNDFNSFKDAMYAMEYGYGEHLEKVEKIMKKTRELVSKAMARKSSIKKDVAGFMPIVPNVIIGNPVNMFNQNIKPRKTPVCKLIIEKAMLANMEVRHNIDYFSVLFALIQEIENRGIRCELWLCASSEEGGSPRNEICIQKIKIKDAMQPINVYKLQFPIISADMFRRIFFRCKEVCPTMQNSDWNWGYGRTLINQSRSHYNTDNEYRPNKGMQEILDITDDYIYIPNVQDSGCKGKSTEETLQFFLEKTALKHYIS